MELVPGQELELRIDSLSSEGDGIARSDGRVVFVPLAAPGDRLRARVRRVEPRWARAELLEVLAAGPERREPPCPYFARCGGCAWLHLSEKAQAQARIDRVREALRRIGGLPDPPPVEYLASPLALGYRARARFASDGENVGLRRRGARDVVDIERCAVLTPEAQRSLEALRRRQPPPGEYEVRGFGPVAEVAGHGYRVGPGSFFQANAALWESWLERVVEACGAGERLVELYAGVAFYGAALEKRFGEVIAVERGAAARDARRNSRARVIAAPVEAWAPRSLASLRPDVVLVNPPRTGCPRRVTDALATSGAGRIVYVSCDPATFARDLARLAGAYTLGPLVALDAFPQTPHVELIAVLDAR